MDQLQEQNLLRQPDSYNPVLDSLRKNRLLYLSLAPYQQDLFRLQTAFVSPPFEEICFYPVS
jgi:hypothetical protein